MAGTSGRYDKKIIPVFEKRESNLDMVLRKINTGSYYPSSGTLRHSTRPTREERVLSEKFPSPDTKPRDFLSYPNDLQGNVIPPRIRKPTEISKDLDRLSSDVNSVLASGGGTGVNAPRGKLKIIPGVLELEKVPVEEFVPDIGGFLGRYKTALSKSSVRDIARVATKTFPVGTPSETFEFYKRAKGTVQSNLKSAAGGIVKGGAIAGKWMQKVGPFSLSPRILSAGYKAISGDEKPNFIDKFFRAYDYALDKMAAPAEEAGARLQIEGDTEFQNILAKAKSPFERFFLQGLGTVAQLTPQILSSYVTGGATASSWLGKIGLELGKMVPFMVQAAGQYTTMAEMEGSSKAEAEAFGLAAGFLEGLTELGPWHYMNNILGAGASRMIKAGASNALKYFGKVGADYVAHTVTNVIQEVMINPGINLLKNITYKRGDPVDLWSWQEASESAKGALAMSMVLFGLGAGNHIRALRNMKNAGQGQTYTQGRAEPAGRQGSYGQAPSQDPVSAQAYDVSSKAAMYLMSGTYPKTAAEINAFVRELKPLAAENEAEAQTAIMLGPSGERVMQTGFDITMQDFALENGMAMGLQPQISPATVTPGYVQGVPVPAMADTEREQRRKTALAALNAHVKERSDAILGEEITSTEVFTFAVEPTETIEEMKLLSEVLGRDIEVVETEDSINLGFNELVLGRESPIFVNKDAHTPAVTASIHGFMHTIDADLRTQLIDVVREEINEKIPEYGRYRASLEAADVNVREGGDSAFYEEVAGDVLGEMATKQSFWKKLYKAAPELADKFVAFIKNIIRKLKALKIPNAYRASKLIKDLKRVEDAAASVVAEQIRRNAAKQKAAEKKPRAKPAAKEAGADREPYFEKDTDGTPYIKKSAAREYSISDMLSGDLKKAIKLKDKDTHIAYDGLPSDEQHDVVSMIGRSQDMVSLPATHRMILEMYQNVKPDGILLLNYEQSESPMGLSPDVFKNVLRDLLKIPVIQLSGMDEAPLYCVFVPRSRQPGVEGKTPASLLVKYQSKEFKEYWKDSKTRDADKKPLMLFHAFNFKLAGDVLDPASNFVSRDVQMGRFMRDLENARLQDIVRHPVTGITQKKSDWISEGIPFTEFVASGTDITSHFGTIWAANYFLPYRKMQGVANREGLAKGKTAVGVPTSFKTLDPTKRVPSWPDLFDRYGTTTFKPPGNTQLELDRFYNELKILAEESPAQFKEWHDNFPGFLYWDPKFSYKGGFPYVERFANEDEMSHFGLGAFHCSIQNPFDLDDVFGTGAVGVFQELCNPDLMDKGIIKDNAAFRQMHDTMDELEKIHGPNAAFPVVWMFNQNPESLALAAKLRKQVLDYLSDLGYDGFRYRNSVEDIGEYSWSPFRPDQIKSIWNTGKWGRGEDNVHYSMMRNDTPGPMWSFKLEELITQKMGKTQPISDVINMITSKGSGIKAEELKWSGILQYLESRLLFGDKVKKEDVIDYLVTNRISISTVAESSGGAITAQTGPADLARHKITGSPEYESYTQKGGTDYAVLVFMFKPKRIYVTWDDFKGQIKEYSKNTDEQWLEGHRNAYRAMLHALIEDEKKYYNPAGPYEPLDSGTKDRTLLLASGITGPTYHHRFMLDFLKASDESRDNGSYDTSRYSNLLYVHSYAANMIMVENRGGYPIPSEGQHFHDDVSNLIGHARIKYRIGDNKIKMLHIEELQSDTMDMGKKVGFKGEPSPVSTKGWKAVFQGKNEGYSDGKNTYKVYREHDLPFETGMGKDGQDVYANTPEDALAKAADIELKNIRGTYASFATGMSDLPFKTSWTEFLLKRLLRWAVDEGCSALTWSGAQEQIRRYGLRDNTVDYIFWSEQNGKYTISNSNTTSDPNSFEKNGWLFDASIEKVADFYGQDIADRILEESARQKAKGPARKRYRIFDSGDQPFEDQKGIGNISEYGTGADTLEEAMALVTQYYYEKGIGHVPVDFKQYVRRTSWNVVEYDAPYWSNHEDHASVEPYVAIVDNSLPPADILRQIAGETAAPSNETDTVAIQPFDVFKEGFTKVSTAAQKKELLGKLRIEPIKNPNMKQLKKRIEEADAVYYRQFWNQQVYYGSYKGDAGKLLHRHEDNAWPVFLYPKRGLGYQNGYYDKEGDQIPALAIEPDAFNAALLRDIKKVLRDNDLFLASVSFYVEATSEHASLTNLTLYIIEKDGGHSLGIGFNKGPMDGSAMGHNLALGDNGIKVKSRGLTTDLKKMDAALAGLEAVFADYKGDNLVNAFMQDPLQNIADFAWYDGSLRYTPLNDNKGEPLGQTTLDSALYPAHDYLKFITQQLHVAMPDAKGQMFINKQLRLRGKGMEKYYGRNGVLQKTLEKYVKKWGVKTGDLWLVDTKTFVPAHEAEVITSRTHPRWNTDVSVSFDSTDAITGPENSAYYVALVDEIINTGTSKAGKGLRWFDSLEQAIVNPNPLYQTPALQKVLPIAGRTRVNVLKDKWRATRLTYQKFNPLSAKPGRGTYYPGYKDYKIASAEVLYLAAVEAGVVTREKTSLDEFKWKFNIPEMVLLSSRSPSTVNTMTMDSNQADLQMMESYYDDKGRGHADKYPEGDYSLNQYEYSLQMAPTDFQNSRKSGQLNHNMFSSPTHIEAVIPLPSKLFKWLKEDLRRANYIYAELDLFNRGDFGRRTDLTSEDRSNASELKDTFRFMKDWLNIGLSSGNIGETNTRSPDLEQALAVVFCSDISSPGEFQDALKDAKDIVHVLKMTGSTGYTDERKQLYKYYYEDLEKMLTAVYRINSYHNTTPRQVSQLLLQKDAVDITPGMTPLNSLSDDISVAYALGGGIPKLSYAFINQDELADSSALSVNGRWNLPVTILDGGGGLRYPDQSSLSGEVLIFHWNPNIKEALETFDGKNVAIQREWPGSDLKSGMLTVGLSKADVLDFPFEFAETDQRQLHKMLAYQKAGQLHNLVNADLPDEQGMGRQLSNNMDAINDFGNSLTWWSSATLNAPNFVYKPEFKDMLVSFNRHHTPADWNITDDFGWWNILDFVMDVFWQTNSLDMIERLTALRFVSAAGHIRQLLGTKGHSELWDDLEVRGKYLSDIWFNHFKGDFQNLKPVAALRAYETNKNPRGSENILSTSAKNIHSMDWVLKEMPELSHEMRKPIFLRPAGQVGGVITPDSLTVDGAIDLIDKTSAPVNEVRSAEGFREPLSMVRYRRVPLEGGVTPPRAYGPIRTNTEYYRTLNENMYKAAIGRVYKAKGSASTDPVVQAQGVEFTPEMVKDIKEKPQPMYSKMRGEEPPPLVTPFFSRLEYAMETKMNDKGLKPASIKSLIKNEQIKAPEIWWTGIMEWLDEQPQDKTVSKEDVLTYIRSQRVEIREIVHSDGDMTFKWQRSGTQGEERYTARLPESMLTAANHYGWDKQVSLVKVGEESYRPEFNVPIPYTMGLSLRETLDSVADRLRYMADDFMYDLSKELGFSAGQHNQFNWHPLVITYENNRELIYCLPISYMRKHLDKISKLARERGLEDSEAVNVAERGYYTKHYPELNIIGTARISDGHSEETTGKDDADVLIVEEFQSDWAIEAHQKGVLGEKIPKEMDPAKVGVRRTTSNGYEYVEFVDDMGLPLFTYGASGIERFWNEADDSTRKFLTGYVAGLSGREDSLSQEEIARVFFAKHALSNMLPDFPTRKYWLEFILKKQLYYGIARGYNKMAWLPGMLQSKRYEDPTVVPDRMEFRLSETLPRQILIDSFMKGMWLAEISGGFSSILKVKDKFGYKAYNYIREKIAAGIRNGTPYAKHEMDGYVGFNPEFYEELYNKRVPSFYRDFLKRYGIEPKEDIVFTKMVYNKGQEVWPENGRYVIRFRTGTPEVDEQINAAAGFAGRTFPSESMARLALATMYAEKGRDYIWNMLENRPVKMYTIDISDPDLIADALGRRPDMFPMFSMQRGEEPGKEISTEVVPQYDQRMTTGGKDKFVPRDDYKGIKDFHTKSKTDKRGKTLKDIADEVYTQAMDVFYPIAQFDSKAGAAPNAGAHARALATRRSGKIARYIAVDAFVDAKGIAKGKSLKDVLRSIKGEKLQQFDDYLVFKHAPSWMKKGRTVFAPELNITIKDVKDRVKEIEAEHPEFVDIHRDLVVFQRMLAKEWLVETGLISIDSFNYFLSEYPNYVPLQRVFEDIEKTGGYPYRRGFVEQPSPIKTGVGSKRGIISPIESIIEHIEHYVRVAKKNEVGQVFMDLIEQNAENFKDIASVLHPEGIALPSGIGSVVEGDILDESGKRITTLYFEKVVKEKGVEGVVEEFGRLFDYLTKESGKPKTTVSVLKNGVLYHIEIYDKHLLDAMMQLEPQQLNVVIRVVGNVTKTMKLLTTGLNLSFGIARNIWRDLVTGYVSSKTVGVNPLHYFTYIGQLAASIGDMMALPVKKTLEGKGIHKGAFHDFIAKAAAHYESYLQMGGGGYASPLAADINHLKRAKQHVLGNTTPFEEMLIILELINNTLETHSRLAEYKRVVKKEGNTYEGRLKAMYEADDVTVNFSKFGNASKFIDFITPFFNAAMQGIDKMGRVVKETPIPAILKAIYSIMIPSILLFLWNHSDDDRRKAYRQVSPYVRDNFFLIAIRDSEGVKFLKIPKPREWGLVFGATVERMLMLFADKDPEAFKEFAGNVMAAWMPPNPLTSNITFPLVRSLVLGKNWQFQDLETYQEKAGSPRYRYDERTSGIAKAIGNVLNMSPKRIDDLMRSYLGGVAQFLIPATSELAQTPWDTFKAQVIVDPVYSTGALNSYYDLKGSLEQKKRDEKSGRYEMKDTEIDALDILDGIDEDLSRGRRIIAAIKTSVDDLPLPDYNFIAMTLGVDIPDNVSAAKAKRLIRQGMNLIAIEAYERARNILYGREE